MPEIEAKTIFDNVTFWRSFTLLLLSFLFGNGTSYLAFGLHTATRSDVEKADQAQTDRTVALESRMTALEKSMNYLTGELHTKGLDISGVPQ